MVDGPEIGPQVSRQQTHQGTLAGAVGADQPGDAGPQLQCHLIDTDDGTIPLRDPFADEHGRHSQRRGHLLDRRCGRPAAPFRGELPFALLRTMALAFLSFHHLDGPDPQDQVAQT